MMTRDEFVKTLKTQLDDLNAGIEKIELKAQSVRENSREKLQVHIKRLREKQTAAVAKIQDVKNAGEEAWLELKQGTEYVVNSLKGAITKTMSHFRKSKNELISEKLSE